MPMSDLDYEEILGLAGRYALSADLGDLASWVSCFTPDGEFVQHTVEGVCRHSGAENRAAFISAWFDRTDGRARHWTDNHDIVGDGVTATMRCYFNRFEISSDGRSPPVLLATGIYHDKLVKLEGKWLFGERHAYVDPVEIPASIVGRSK